VTLASAIPQCRNIARHFRLRTTGKKIWGGTLCMLHRSLGLLSACLDGLWRK
jgi:hypothetical protein